MLPTFPVECLTISDGEGTRMRATVSEFGPVLLSKILQINETQSGIISLIFKYCDDNELPLLDLKDLKKMLHHITGEGKAEIEKEIWQGVHYVGRYDYQKNYRVGAARCG